MKIETLLAEQIKHHDLCPGATTIEQWSSKTWLQTHVGDRLVPVFPLWPIRDALSKHDIHHILTGYKTDVEGEAELAAWELGSGGCHLNLLFWFDRLAFSIIGLFIHPTATVRAFRRGLSCRNLFSRQMNSVLDSNVDDVRRDLNL